MSTVHTQCTDKKKIERERETYTKEPSGIPKEL